MRLLRYNLIGAYQSGVHVHPQEDMKRLNLKIQYSEPCPIADAWFFCIQDCSCVLPSYIDDIGCATEFQCVRCGHCKNKD